MELSKRSLSPWFLLALLVLLALVSLRIAGVFLNYILMGLFLAVVTHPAYDWLEERIRVKGVASLLMVVAVTLLLFVPLAFVMVELVQELRNILAVLDPTALRAQLEALTRRFVGDWAASEDGSGGGLVDVLVPSINTFASQVASRILSALAEGSIGVFVMLYILYYSYHDGHRFVDLMGELVPLQDAHRDLIFREIENVIKAVMYGHILTALIQAVLGGIGFWIFGVENVIFWSFIMFILALLPIVGPPLVWAPWGVYLLLSGQTFQGIGLLVYSFLMVSTLDNVLRPKLIGDYARIHPTVILIGVLGGIVVFGFSGLILGPLVLSIFVSILGVYRKEFAKRMSEGDLPT